MYKTLVFVAAMGFGTVAMAKGGARPEGSKEPAAAPEKTGNIKDEEAVRCILDRLTDETGVKSWKVELKDVSGSSREFVATSGARSEKGTVNVAKSYPNGGSLRVYLVPRD